MLQFVSVVTTSAVVATIIGFLLNLFLARLTEHSSARLEALRAAVALEGYAIFCADAVSKHDIAVSSEEHAGKFIGALPDLPEIEISIGLLRPKRAIVANHVAIFPQEVQQADQSITFWWDIVGDLDAARNAAKHACARIGIQSLKLASELRSTFDLPERKLVFGQYDILKSLQKIDNSILEESF